MLEEAQPKFYSILYDKTIHFNFNLFLFNKNEEVLSRHLKTVFLGKLDGETLYNNIISILEDSNLSLSKLWFKWS